MPLFLTPSLQHYAWGGDHYLYDLMEQQPSGKPAAELWLGAHPKAPAMLTGTDKTLIEYIATDPNKVLGSNIVEQFGPHLPYLMKVLDVRKMLSIQVHPDKKTAETGFAREEAKGIARTSPNRNYRDNNHKPELGVAISDFYLLHGFKSTAAIRQSLIGIPEWTKLLPIFENEGTAGLYEYVMQAEQETIDQLLSGLGFRLLGGQYNRMQPEFWARRAVEQYTDQGHFDRGIFSIYWLNLVHLRSGEGIFQAAGIPHAYLEGQCIELMAASDNVIRGGLTQKHIDVAELLTTISFDPVSPVVLSPLKASDGWSVYHTPVSDFKLTCLNADADCAYEICAQGAETLLLFSGIASAGNLQLNPSWRIILLQDGERITISTHQPTIIFRAGVGRGI